MKERFGKWNAEAAQKFGDKPYKWILICGDIANMYDELDHDGIMPATRWGCEQLAEWIGRRRGTIKGVTVNYSTGDVVAGHRYEDYDVYVPFEQLLDICDYDNKHCWMQWRDEVFARLLGVPMGGLLSPHKANMTLGQRESFFLAVLRSLGLVGGGIRFMDDVVLAIAVGCALDVTLAEQWISLVCGANGYPRPLVLEVEERATSYGFLELTVSSNEKLLQVAFQSKFGSARTDKDVACAYSRYPDGGDAMTTRERTQYVTGHLHRIVDGSMFEDSIEISVAHLAEEVSASNWDWRHVREAVFNMVYNREGEVWCAKKLREVLGTLNWMIGGF